MQSGAFVTFFRISEYPSPQPVAVSLSSIIELSAGSIVTSWSFCVMLSMASLVFIEFNGLLYATFFSSIFRCVFSMNILLAVSLQVTSEPAIYSRFFLLRRERYSNISSGALNSYCIISSPGIALISSPS